MGLRVRTSHRIHGRGTAPDPGRRRTSTHRIMISGLRLVDREDVRAGICPRATPVRRVRAATAVAGPDGEQVAAGLRARHRAPGGLLPTLTRLPLIAATPRALATHRMLCPIRAQERFGQRPAAMDQQVHTSRFADSLSTGPHKVDVLPFQRCPHSQSPSTTAPPPRSEAPRPAISYHGRRREQECSTTTETAGGSQPK
jgi:hypothetical protein